MSPLDAINARVLHEAQRELVYSSLSIKQIAAAIGFDDEAYFGRFFKKHTGQRPTEFREAARAHLART
jgi:AraC family transcriptional activator of pobA